MSSCPAPRVAGLGWAGLGRPVNARVQLPASGVAEVETQVDLNQGTIGTLPRLTRASIVPILCVLTLSTSGFVGCSACWVVVDAT